MYKGNIENVGVAWGRGYMYMYPVYQHQGCGQRDPRFLCTCVHVYHVGALLIHVL